MGISLYQVASKTIARKRKQEQTPATAARRCRHFTARASGWLARRQNSGDGGGEQGRGAWARAAAISRLRQMDERRKRQPFRPSRSSSVYATMTAFCGIYVTHRWAYRWRMRVR